MAKRGALKIWSNTTDSSLKACLGQDIETQTWRPYDCPPTPRNADRFVIALLSGANGEPDFRHAAEVQKILDLCFVSDAERRMLPVELRGRRRLNRFSRRPIQARDGVTRRQVGASLFR